MKSLYHDPRPYYYDNDVKGLSCSGGYGNPSGHNLTTNSFLIFIWSILFDFEKESLISSYKNQILSFRLIFLKYFSLSLIIFIILNIMFARLYLGSHSIDQIIYGLIIGLNNLILFRYILIDFLLKELSFENRLTNSLLISILICILLIICNFGFFIYIKEYKYDVYYPEVYLNMLLKKCGDNYSELKLFLNQSFLSTHFSLFIFISLFFGNYISFCFNFNRIHLVIDRKQNILQLIYRIIILLIFLGITFSIYLALTLKIKSILMISFITIPIISFIPGCIFLPIIDFLSSKILFQSEFLNESESVQLKEVLLLRIENNENF